MKDYEKCVGKRGIDRWTRFDSLPSYSFVEQTKCHCSLEQVLAFLKSKDVPNGNKAEEKAATKLRDLQKDRIFLASEIARERSQAAITTLNFAGARTSEEGSVDTTSTAPSKKRRVTAQDLQQNFRLSFSEIL